MGSHFSTAAPPTHLSVAVRVDVGSAHPEITGATKACLFDFGSLSASERVQRFVSVICNQSDGIDVPILREISNPDKRRHPFAHCAGRCLNRGVSGH